MGLLCCPNFKTRHSSKRRRTATPQPATIEICSSPQSTTARWRVSKLSFDASENADLVSQRLVTQILALNIHPFDKETSFGLPISTYNGQRIETEGYVDLVWCLQNTRQIHNTRFLVTKAFDPPFDAVLGRRSTMETRLASEQHSWD